eukprot:2803817-Pyramimonas_sp.AAC.1
MTWDSSYVNDLIRSSSDEYSDYSDEDGYLPSTHRLWDSCLSERNVNDDASIVADGKAASQGGSTCCGHSSTPIGAVSCLGAETVESSSEGLMSCREPTNNESRGRDDDSLFRFVGTRTLTIVRAQRAVRQAHEAAVDASFRLSKLNFTGHL